MLFIEIENFIEVYNNSVIELIQCFGTSFFGRIDHLASSVINSDLVTCRWDSSSSRRTTLAGVVGTPPPSLHLSLSRSLEGILKHPGQTLGNLQVKPCETPRDGAVLVYTPETKELGPKTLYSFNNL